MVHRYKYGYVSSNCTITTYLGGAQHGQEEKVRPEYPVRTDERSKGYSHEEKGCTVCLLPQRQER